MTVPGPGTYDFVSPEKSMRASPSCRIGTSTRDDELKVKQRVQNYPPPNTYNPSFLYSKRSEPSYGFGSSVRQPLAPKKNVPAPSAYNVPERLVEGPRFHMGSKCERQSALAIEAKKTVANPGPGTYAPQFYKTVHKEGSYSIKGRHPIKDTSFAPGPGAYQANDSPAKTRAPNVRFGSAAQREPLKPSVAPGPGNYHIPSTMANLPAYTGARSKDFAHI